MVAEVEAVVAPIAVSILQDVIVSTAQHLWNLMSKHLPESSNKSAALAILESSINTALKGIQEAEAQKVIDDEKNS